MAKTKDTKKETKKAPAKSLKENELIKKQKANSLREDDYRLTIVDWIYTNRVSSIYDHNRPTSLIHHALQF